MTGKISKILIIGIICGCITVWSSEFNVGKVLLSTIINFVAYGEFEIGAEYVFFFLQRYFPILLFQALCGTYIYEHFCTASVYFFTRIANREKWYMKEIIKFLGYVLEYVLIFTMIFLFGICWKNIVLIDKTGIYYLLFYLISQILWLYTMTLLVNVISIYFGSSNGFLSIVGIQMFFLCYYIIFEQVLNDTSEKMQWIIAILLNLNPLSHLILKWHEECNMSVSLSFGCSIGYLIVISIVTTIIGLLVVTKKQDFVITEREIGGYI